MRPDIHKLCAGQEAGWEEAIHVVSDLFDLDSTHGFIQVVASNALNSINRQILLHNVKILCPDIATYIRNCYIQPA